MQYSVETEGTFEAAHTIVNHPGKCSRMHGHSYRVRVTVAGEKDPKSGMVQDFGDISGPLKELLDLFDHRIINDMVPNMIPTAENIAGFFFEQLLMTIPLLKKVEVWEGYKHSAIATSEQRFLR